MVSHIAGSMYRQQSMPSTPNPSMHSWYAAGYHQAPQMAPSEQQLWDQPTTSMWHHPHSHHSVFATNDYHQDYVHPSQLHAGMEAGHNHSLNQLMPSPSIAASSELSSPGAASGHLSPPQISAPMTRAPQARSPYEWIKKGNCHNLQPNPGKTRTKDKYRVVYTDHQRVELEKEFYYSRYITIRRKSELAGTLGLSERQVKIWFQNRRAKERKQSKKRDEYTLKDPNPMGHLQPQQLLHNPQSQMGQGILTPQLL